MVISVEPAGWKRGPGMTLQPDERDGITPWSEEMIVDFRARYQRREAQSAKRYRADENCGCGWIAVGFILGALLNMLWP